jgi:hypothetical protein
MTEVKRITGAFTGAYAINPFNNEKDSGLDCGLCTCRVWNGSGNGSAIK